jgi:hypothetical protein
MGIISGIGSGPAPPPRTSESNRLTIASDRTALVRTTRSLTTRAERSVGPPGPAAATHATALHNLPGSTSGQGRVPPRGGLLDLVV